MNDQLIEYFHLGHIYKTNKRKESIDDGIAQYANAKKNSQCVVSLRVSMMMEKVVRKELVTRIKTFYMTIAHLCRPGWGRISSWLEIISPFKADANNHKLTLFAPRSNDAFHPDGVSMEYTLMADQGGVRPDGVYTTIIVMQTINGYVIE
jgi:hypothetical protein